MQNTTFSTLSALELLRLFTLVFVFGFAFVANGWTPDYADSGPLKRPAIRYELLKLKHLYQVPGTLYDALRTT